MCLNCHDKYVPCTFDKPGDGIISLERGHSEWSKVGTMLSSFVRCSETYDRELTTRQSKAHLLQTRAKIIFVVGVEAARLRPCC